MGIQLRLGTESMQSIFSLEPIHFLNAFVMALSNVIVCEGNYLRRRSQHICFSESEH